MAQESEKHLPVDQKPSTGFVPLDGNESLLRLQTQIRAAVAELERLQQENTELHQRIRKLMSEENTRIEDMHSDTSEAASTISRFEDILQGHLKSTPDDNG